MGNVNDRKSVDSLKGVIRQIVCQQCSRDGMSQKGHVSCVQIRGQGRAVSSTGWSRPDVLHMQHHRKGLRR
jgi:NMD protein affecting ribosome stability and mRNA decay